MASQYTKVTLSNSLNGRQILVSGSTSGSATLIHTAIPAIVSGSSLVGVDEVYLYATNNSTSSLTCSILWGGTTEPNDLVRVILPPQNSRTLIADGKLLQGGLNISAYGQLPNQIVVDGFVNRIIDSAIDPFVSVWAQRVVNNSSPSFAPSYSTQLALTTFYKGLVSTGLASKMAVVNCFVPDNLTASLTPLIVNGNDPWVNNNFTGSDLSVNGLKGDGSSRYLNTGFNASTSTSRLFNNEGITIYLFTSASGGVDQTDCGAQASPGNSQAFNFFPSDKGTTYFDCYNNVGGRLSAASPTSSNGYWSANRTSTSLSTIYFANSTSSHSTFASSNTSGGTSPNLSIFLFTLNIDGSPYGNGYTNSRVSFFAIHSGLSSNDSQNLFNLVQQMRINLGGGFV